MKKRSAKGPNDYSEHPAGKEGGFYWQAAKDGATEFGFVAIAIGGIDNSPLYPMNWPGGDPEEGHAFVPAAQWPSGEMRVDESSLAEGDSRCFHSEVDAVSFSDYFMHVLDIEIKGDERERREAKDLSTTIMRLSKDGLNDEQIAFFTAGARAANLLAGREIQYWRSLAELRKGGRRKSSEPEKEYRKAVALAMQLYPGVTGSVQLLKKIGSRRVPGGKEWRDWLGREVFFSEWADAVKAARRPGASNVI